MKKDNSSISRAQVSDLILQVNRLNEIMEMTAKNILDTEQLDSDFKETLRSYQEYKDIKKISSVFASCFIAVKQNTITTEKYVDFEISDYFDVSKNSPFVQRLSKAKQSSVEDLKNAQEIIAQEIEAQMVQYVSQLLEKLNKYSNIKFYLKSTKTTFKCYGTNLYNQGLNTDMIIKFLIDII